MTIVLKTNTAVRLTVGPFLDKTDGITPEVALTATNEHLTLMVDTGGVPTLVLDANATGSGGSNDMVHVTNDDAGYYDLELTAAQLNYLGNAKLAITYATDHCPVFHDIVIVTANVWDTLFSTDKLDVNVSSVNGTAQTAGDLASLITTIDTVVDTINTNVTDLHTNHLPPAADTIAAAVWNDVCTGHTTAGTFGLYLGGAPTIGSTLAADIANVHTDVGTVAGYIDTEIGDLHTDVGTVITNLATVDGIVDTINGHITADYTATEKAAIDLLDDADGGLADVHTVVNDLHTDVADNHTDIATAIGYIDTEVGAIKTQTDKLTFTVANKIDSNVYTWNGTAVATPDTAGYPKVTIKSGTGTGEISLSSGAVPVSDKTGFSLSAAGIDAIWDELVAAHTTAATFGLYLGGAPTIGSTLAADIANVHTDLATVAGYVDTEVAAILAAVDTEIGDLHTDVGTVISNLATVDGIVDTINGHITADYTATEKAAIDLLDDADGGLADVHTVVNDLHTDVATAITNIGDVHATDLPAIKTILDNLHDTDIPDLHTDIATVDGIVDTINGHVQADYTATEKAAIDLLDDASGGLVDIHTDVGTVITNVGDVHSTDLPAIKTVVDNLHDTDIPDLHTDIGTVISNLATVDGIVDTINGHITADYGSTEKAAIDLLDDGSTGTLHLAMADAFLKRDWTQVSGEAARSVLNALRFFRNKVYPSEGTLHICKEDDVTDAWTAAYTSNPNAEPITSIDPTT